MTTDLQFPMTEPRQDPQLVTPAGERVERRIDGVLVRPAITQFDERGELTEIFDPAWGFATEPLVFLYQVIATPGSIRGWVVHRKQEDRLFFSLGRFKLVLYDDRAGSPTHGLVNEHFYGERNRALVRIPAGVFHAVQNVGTTDALFVNLPTRAYRHADPDKHRLPLDNDLIPYRFEQAGPHRRPGER